MIQATSTKVKQQRLHWVDYAKGIGIFLVVVGHTLRGLVKSSILEESAFIMWVDRWIYAFHMPLFFFISGLFVVRSLSKPFKSFVLDKISVIVYPYFIWSILQNILQILTSRYTNQPVTFTDIWRIIYQPYQQFWFLYTLFIILLAYAIFHKLRISPVIFLAFSVFIYILYCLDISIGPWGILYLVRRYAIYFALGLCFGSSNLLTKINQLKVLPLLLTIVVGYLAIALAVVFKFDENPIAIFIIATIGIAASTALSVLLQNFNTMNFVKQWGIFSLEIYVAHIIAASSARIFLQKMFHISEPIVHLLIGTYVGIYGPIAFSKICSKLGFQYMFKLRSLKA
ncbi:acyltransferase [Tolypothrix bouteillei VB521301]|uniref:Acyltransferase n=3 Tax=Nostocales TaxID=1161 RepID=A0A0C1R777_9CYAN|nr:acyltransferase [Tolypothrix bouteillei VB521301]